MAIRSAVEWLRKRKAKRFLIIGKGPSFSRYLDLPDEHGFHVVGINNCCLHRSVQVTHITDLHNVEQTGQALIDNSDVVVLPWYPHVGNKPGGATLEQLLKEQPLLARLCKEDRLFTYNSSLAFKQRRGPGPVVPVRYFSAVAVVGLLAVSGVRMVRTLGIDGGSEYSPLFDKRNLGLNGRTSFDIQSPEIRKICKRYRVDYAPLETA